MSTYGELRPQIQRNLGGRDSTDDQAAILANFNHAQKILARRKHRFKELEVELDFNMVAGTDAYTHSTMNLVRFRKEYSISLVDSSYTYNQRFMTWDRWRKRILPIVPQATLDRPYTYTKWGKKFIFWYVPDSAYVATVKYYQYPAPVTVDGSTITFDDIDDLLVSLTTQVTAMSFEEYSIADHYNKITKDLYKEYSIDDKEQMNFTPGTDDDEAGVQEYDSQFYNNPFIDKMP